MWRLAPVVVLFVVWAPARGRVDVARERAGAPGLLLRPGAPVRGRAAPRHRHRRGCRRPARARTHLGRRQLRGHGAVERQVPHDRHAGRARGDADESRLDLGREGRRRRRGGGRRHGRAERDAGGRRPLPPPRDPDGRGSQGYLDPLGFLPAAAAPAAPPAPPVPAAPPAAAPPAEAAAPPGAGAAPAPEPAVAAAPQPAPGASPVSEDAPPSVQEPAPTEAVTPASRPARGRVEPRRPGPAARCSRRTSRPRPRCRLRRAAWRAAAAARHRPGCPRARRRRRPSRCRRGRRRARPSRRRRSGPRRRPPCTRGRTRTSLRSCSACSRSQPGPRSGRLV